MASAPAYAATPKSELLQAVPVSDDYESDTTVTMLTAVESVAKRVHRVRATCWETTWLGPSTGSVFCIWLRDGGTNHLLTAIFVPSVVPSASAEHWSHEFVLDIDLAAGQQIGVSVTLDSSGSEYEVVADCATY